jgi:adenine-specific DNA methylase
MMTYSRDRPSSTAGPEKRQRHSHIWAREQNEHYVEPAWCSERVFDEELFVGSIHDPCCGFGTIPEAAHRVGLKATSLDFRRRQQKLVQSSR